MIRLPDITRAAADTAGPAATRQPATSAARHRRTILVVIGIVALAALLVAPNMTSSRYIVYLGTLLALQGVLAVSLNIIMGFAGQFALAHAAFYGLGAYVSAILIRDWDMSFWGSIGPTVAFAAVLAVVIGYPSLRFTGGIHFALITFAFGELIRLITANWHGMTGGPQGLQISFTPDPVFGIDFSTPRGIYALAAGLLVVSLIIAAVIRYSRFGRSLVAIREDEVLASSLGINVTLNKVVAFAITSVMAALAGTLYGPFVGFISPEMMSAGDSVSVVGMLIVGGMGTLSGPIFGTLIFMGLPELLRVAKLYRLVILGVIIVAVVLFAPKGVAGLLDRLVKPYRKGTK